MPVFPLLVNGIKLFLVLGVGLGGHQIYGAVSGRNFVDDGYFYNISKMSSDWKDNKHGVNKVYDKNSAITEENKYLQDKDIREHYSQKWDLHKDWGFSNRMKLLEEGGYHLESSIYKIIKDHTVKLVMPCQSGTGWLLDFELPAGNQKYPTRWFIATNLHVINKFVFKDNPYQASLPITEESRSAHLPWYLRNGNYNYRYRQIDECISSIYNKNSSLKLFTEEDVRDRNSTDLNYIDYYQHENSYKTWDHFAGRWRNNSVYDTSFRSPRIYTTTVANPKLVYSAVNFLGPRYTASGHQINNKEDYFKDFGVLEVEFANENQARLMTNKVFEKYYKDKVNKHIQPSNNIVNLSGKNVNSINFFAPELMSKYSPEELAKFEDNFFIGGYPGSVAENLSFTMNQKFKVVARERNFRNYWYGNYEEVIKAIPTKSKLTYFKEDRKHILPTNYNLKNSSGGIIPGHADLSAIDKHSDSSKIEWNGKKLSGWGYNYLVNNAFLGSGASGSMVLDQKGSLLGLYRMYNPGLDYGFIEPIRGSWVVDSKTGKVVLPGFDLISGTGKNVVSYRSQLEKFNPSAQTYLKSQNWTIN